MTKTSRSSRVLPRSQAREKLKNMRRLINHRVKGPGTLLLALYRAVMPGLGPQRTLKVALPQPALMRSDSTRISTPRSLAHTILPATPPHHLSRSLLYGIWPSSIALSTQGGGQGQAQLSRHCYRIWRRKEAAAVTTPILRTNHYHIIPLRQRTWQGTIMRSYLENKLNIMT